MITKQWYAVRLNVNVKNLPWELGEVLSTWNSYSDASKDCDKRFNEGQKDVCVTTYESTSQLPTKTFTTARDQNETV